MKRAAVLLTLAVAGQGAAVNPAATHLALDKVEVVKPKVAAPAADKSTPLPVALKAKVAAAPKQEKAAPAAKASLRAPTKDELAKTKAAKPALVSYTPKISPPLHDGDAVEVGHHQSDKKFFGPPFPADYPEDKRPVPDKSVMDKLKGPDQPYPALQSKADYDRDYVKDENSDSGAWKAQFEYDSLRNKIANKKFDADRAAGKAGKEGQDAKDAQGNADRAAKDVEDAKKGVNDALSDEDDAKKAEDFEGIAPSAEKLEQIKTAVAQAEANLAKEKLEFEQCKKALEDAERNLKELKAAQVEMEAKLAADTKLWIEQKSVRMQALKDANEASHSNFLKLKSGADSKLKAAQDVKAEADKVLAEKKARNDRAVKNLQKEQNELEQAKKDMAKATLRLQKLRGYTPAEEVKAVVKPWWHFW